MLKVTVDLTKCECSGRCYEYSDDVFEKGPKDQAKVIMPEIGDDDWGTRASAEAAQNSCPTGAIIVEEVDE